MPPPSNTTGLDRLRPGDRLFISTIDKGRLFLAGAMTVGRVLSRAAAATALNTSPESIWDAGWHVFAREGSASTFERRDVSSLAPRIRFAAPSQTIAMKDGKVKGQALRTMRPLTPESADLLEREIQGSLQAAEVDGHAGLGQLLVLAEGPADVLESVAVFNATVSRHADRARVLARSTRYWVYAPTREEFGPSKFVAFQGMSFPLYEHALSRGVDGDRFDGGLTHKTVEALTGASYRASPGLSQKLESWARTAIGEEAFAGIRTDKWLFLAVSGDVEATPREPNGATRDREVAPTRRAAERKPENQAARKVVAEAAVDLRHNRIQNQLLPVLQDLFGKNNVAMEQDYVDFQVRLPERKVLIEVKSDDDPRDALTKAVGQLLYYAHFKEDGSHEPPLELIVVAPGKATPAVDAYVQRLKALYSLPLRYVSYEEGSRRLAI